MATKSQKELAFLRDLVSADWTEPFTNLIDENLKFEKNEKILYVNAGAGNHTIALAKKLGKNAGILGVCEDAELLKIAKAKAEAVKSEAEFTLTIPTEKFDTVIADASFIKPSELDNFLTQILEYSANRVAFFLPTAGSFGEIFSILWETMLDEKFIDTNVDVETLLIEIPTITNLESLVENLGLTKLETFTANEIFEFENGELLTISPLISKFFFPKWFENLTGKEKKQVTKKLAQVIDNDDQELTFRYTVKSTLIVGVKV